MTYRMHISPTQRTGFVQLAGSVTGQDIFQANQQLYAHPDWQPGFDECWDCSSITSLVVDPGEIHEIVEQEVEHAAALGQGRVAIVATSYNVEMIGQLYKVMLEHSLAGRPVQLFRTPEAAQRWLGNPSLPTWISEAEPVAAPGVPRVA